MMSCRGIRSLEPPCGRPRDDQKQTGFTGCGTR